MYKSKTKQRKANRDSMRKLRSKQGITKGITGQPKLDMSNYPHILDKLTEPIWRGRLEKICLSFRQSHHPKYNEDVYFCEDGFPLNIACDWLEVTG